MVPRTGEGLVLQRFPSVAQLPLNPEREHRPKSDEFLVRFVELKPVRLGSRFPLSEKRVAAAIVGDSESEIFISRIERGHDEPIAAERFGDRVFGDDVSA